MEKCHYCQDEIEQEIIDYCKRQEKEFLICRKCLREL